MSDPAKVASGLPGEAAAVPVQFADAPRPRFRRWRRLLVAAVACVGLAALMLLGVLYYRSYVTEVALREAIAEADRLDPGWRLAELDAKRIAVPFEQNSESQVRKAGGGGMKLLNAGGTMVRGTNRDVLVDSIKPIEDLELLSPRFRLTFNQAAALRTALVPFTGPLTDGRKIADFPNGRCVFDSSLLIDQPWNYEMDASTAVSLLEYDAVLQTQNGDFDQAWVCCRAILNIGRSFGDEPIEFPQMNRAYRVRIAIGLMERTLAHGQVPEKELAESQKRLREELQHPALLIYLRSIRARCHFQLTLVETGQLQMHDLRFWFHSGSLEGKGITNEMRGFLFSNEFSDREAKPAHVWLLRYTTQTVELAKLPEKDAYPALQKLESTIADAPDLARRLVPRAGRVAFLQQYRATFGCAFAGLAAERYRLKHDRWPTELADLVAERLLDAVPADPYDGKPLRYRTTADGVVVYSVGPSGDGKGDDLDANPTNMKDDRVEFRLWDADKR
jgi:hypothetical protein